MKIVGNKVLSPVFRIAVGSLIVVMSFSLFFMWRVQQARTGICRDNNRKLTKQELRQAVLQNLINLEVEATNIHEEIFHNGTIRTGIVRNPTELDVRNLMGKVYTNDRSFEENFSIEMIAPGDRGFDVSQLEEPFMLVRYGTYPSGRATIIISTDIWQIENPSRLLTKYKTSSYDRFHGFGNYYFHIKRTNINRECCDNRDYGRSRKEYLNRKQKAYQESLSSFARNIAAHDGIATVSNCGELLTEKSENGLNQDLIKLIGGRIEQ